MSTNLEPIVNKIVTNTTAKDVFHNLDLNLIDPYKIIDMDEIKESKEYKESKDNKEKKVKKDKKNIIEDEIFDIDKEDDNDDFEFNSDSNNIINEGNKFVNNFTEEIKRNNQFNLTNINTNKSNLKGKIKKLFLFYFYSNSIIIKLTEKISLRKLKMRKSPKK